MKYKQIVLSTDKFIRDFFDLMAEYPKIIDKNNKKYSPNDGVDMFIEKEPFLYEVFNYCIGAFVTDELRKSGFTFNVLMPKDKKNWAQYKSKYKKITVADVREAAAVYGQYFRPIDEQEKNIAGNDEEYTKKCGQVIITYIKSIFDAIARPQDIEDLNYYMNMGHDFIRAMLFPFRDDDVRKWLK